jgi:uncharacterized protein
MRSAIARRPVLSFFVIAFGFSWVMWTPFVLSSDGLGVVAFHFPRLLGTAQLAGVLPGAYLGPLSAALIVTAMTEGRAGTARWARRLVRWRVNWRWYLVALVGTPLAILSATLLLPASWGHVALPVITAAALYPAMVGLQFVTTAAAEEPGWRDFALPRLQGRFGAVAGTVVLGTLWGMWHLPLFLTTWGDYGHITILQPIEFIVACIPLSIVMTWVFNRSGQSLPIVMLLHASINATFTLLWPLVFPTLDAEHDVLHTQLIASTLIALALVVVTRGRLGLGIEKGRATPPAADVPSVEAGARMRARA